MEKRYHNQSTTEDFIKKSVEIHGNKYNYSKVEYINNKTKVCIICLDHGEFWQTPNGHLRGQKCKKCNYQPKLDLSHIETPPGSKAVPLTQGKYALVDEEDYDRVMQYNWYYSKNGYAVNNSVGLMHRFILNGVTDMITDHINRNRLDCRRSNLRLCTYKQNNQNRKKAKGLSKYKGVSFDNISKKWTAQINIDSKRKKLGRFYTEEDAALAYDEAAKKHFGEFAYLNILV